MSSMKVCTTNRALSSSLERLKASDSSLGFIPTMGALHQGHVSLIQKAIAENSLVVVSIFVNPTQFDNKSDLETYPQNLNKDIETISAIGSDKIVVYAPSTQDVYKGDLSKENFDFGGLEHQMEGKHRPGHFDGVATVVYKLLQIVRPDMAYFGEKDFQQLQIVKKLVSVIGASINIIGCPIAREPSGLAMSSRNKRLCNNERKHASKIYQILKAVEQKFETVPNSDIRKWVQAQFENDPYINLEYFEISEVSTLESALTIAPNKKYRAFVAVFIRDVRLIDNIALN